ncbi:MAG TPA: flagellar biosynthesis protein FliP [Planctomycetes bacterium]|nr:flagellar type III secretion system pore protein FliP [Fuerstiella sp.]HIK92391.1 flagellar biosynthesis protein FliP [Planctomycetota bacterium]
MDSASTLQQVVESGAFQELSPQLKVALFLGGMAFLSSALVTMTAFTRIVIVLSFVRRALATQEIPPTQVILGLSLFLTFFVMGPTFSTIETDAIKPYLAEEISGDVAFQNAANAIHGFMLAQTRRADIALFRDMADRELVIQTAQDTPMRILIPAYVISELKTAFIMGFCLYIPFMLIDLVVSVILMSLGMMMMPPMIISTPFKILLFVMVDGWQLIARVLSMSFH